MNADDKRIWLHQHGTITGGLYDMYTRMYHFTWESEYTLYSISKFGKTQDAVTTSIYKTVRAELYKMCERNR